MKRKFACGTVALCLALSVAGCGKNSEERQAANYYQNELGLDKDEAEDLAHYLYGEDEEEEEPSVSEEAPQETVVEPLPELLDSEWYDRKVQILDMVFNNDWHMTEEDIRKIVEGSAYNVEIVEDFDENGDICIKDLTVNGEEITWGKSDTVFDTTFNSEDSAHSVMKFYGWFNDELCFHVRTNYLNSNKVYWCNKPLIEFADFKTRDDVLAYLSEKGFVEVEKEQACYTDLYPHDPLLYSEKISAEYVDTPHYYCQGVQSITFYRMHKLDETDQEIEVIFSHYSGASLYLLNKVSFNFNTDGTIQTWNESTYEAMILGKEK